MILIRNLQRSMRIPLANEKLDLQLLMSAAGYRNYDLGVCLTSNKELRRLNATYRGKDKPTDILSFPFAQAIEPGKLPKPETPDHKNLGDIYISLPYVQKWCLENSVKVDDRLPVLYAHGICHLLGYDHETEEEYRLMQRRENYLLRKRAEWKAALKAQEDGSGQEK